MRTRIVGCMMLALLSAAGCKKESDEIATPLHYAAGRGDTGVVLRLLRQGADIEAKDTSGRTPLFIAACCQMHWSTPASLKSPGHPMVQLLLDNGASVNASDKWGYSVLHGALRNHRMDVAEYLLSRGAYVRTQSQDGETPLHEAAKSGSTKLVSLLVAKGANVNVPARNGDTPLLCAIAGDSPGTYGSYAIGYNQIGIERVRRHIQEAYRRCSLDSDHMRVIRFLVAKGAEINATNTAGETALSYAVQSGDLDLIQLLLDSGAEPNYATAPDRVPATLAMNSNWTDIARLLVARGANVTLHLAVYLGDLEKARALIQNGSDVNARGQAGEAPLHMAARSGSHDLAELLINTGADVNAQDATGWTPLHEAAWSGHKDITELLVARGAAVSARTTKVGRSDYHIRAYAVPGTTPLHLAVKYPEVAKVLIASGADLNAKDEYYGETPIRRAVNDGDRRVVDLLVAAGADMDLHLAAYTGYAQRVKRLIEAGANVNAPDDRGRTPLRFAVLGGHADVAEVLIESGADPNATYDHDWDGRNQTLLHKAAQMDHVDVARVLIAYGPNVRAQDGSGKTALHVAAYFGSASVVEVLLAHGADPNVRTIIDNKTALNYAQEAGFADVARLLGGDAGKLARGPYRVIITDPNAIRAFLDGDMGADEVWAPSETQFQEFEAALKTYLRENIAPDSANEQVLLHLRRFNREFAGLTSKGRRYIICNLDLGELDKNPPDNRFTHDHTDAWWTITHVIYDVDNKTIVRVDPT